MTETAIVHTDLPDSHAAGTALGTAIADALDGVSPDVVILFASSRYDYAPLLAALSTACGPALLLGSSSAGEFTAATQGTGLACAIALRSADMQFAVGVGRGLRADRRAAAEQIAASFRGMATHEYLYRSALVLTDALAGYTDDLIGHLTVLTAGGYQLFGGGAGDDANFHRTHVFAGTEAIPDAAVALEILSNKPVGIGVAHGWQSAGRPMRVTEVDGMRLVSLNAAPAVEIFREHAAATGQAFDVADPVPFFLHNVLGIASESGYKLRVPLTVEADGSITCASDIPTGATVAIMRSSASAATDAAARATEAALHQMDGHPAAVALFFDCVATRLRLGEEFGLELAALEELLGPVAYAGCNTYGQIARADGQFSGFHNCTAVVCTIPA